MRLLNDFYYFWELNLNFNVLLKLHEFSVGNQFSIVIHPKAQTFNLLNIAFSPDLNTKNVTSTSRFF